MNEDITYLCVDDILFDTNNPRIKLALEKYGDNLDADRIHFALSSATEGSKGTSSYESLRDSIHTSNGILFPIIVVAAEDGYVCIDGNTRLAIYKQFLREKTSGNWHRIKAVIINDHSQKEIETIRVTAHLVGAREWPAYEKARYLHYLRNTQLMDFAEMINLCGGNKLDINRQIDAFHDMNEFYRDRVDDTAFQIDRFSGFVELQRPKVKDAIFSADLTLEDFGDWIRDGKIYRLADVRQLPAVLGDPEAKDIFLNGGVNSIAQAIDKIKSRLTPSSSLKLNDASIFQLANALTEKINNFPFARLLDLKNEEFDSQGDFSVLESLFDSLQAFIDNISDAR